MDSRTPVEAVDAESAETCDSEVRRPRLPLLEEVAITSWPEAGVVATTAVTTGALTGSTAEMAVAGGVALATDFVARLHEVVRENRKSRVDEAVEFTAELAGRSVSRVVDEVLADPRLAELAETVLEAAALKAQSLHRKALSHCLANGLDDAVVIDAEALVARVLADLTVPHVELLARLSLPSPKSGAAYVRWPIYTLETLQKTMPGMSESLDPLLATLCQHGLAVQHQTGSSMFSRTFVITDFGWHVLGRLKAEGLKVKRPKTEPISPRTYVIDFSGPSMYAERLVEEFEDGHVYVQDALSRMAYADVSADRVSGQLVCIGHLDDIEKVVQSVDTRANIASLQSEAPPVVEITVREVDETSSG